MTRRSAPPPTIDSCKVLAYVTVPGDITLTDVLKLNVDGKWIGKVPRLAICEWDYRPILMLFHCDERWNSLGVQSWERPGPSRARSVAEVIARVERYYPGVGRHWTFLEEAHGGAYAPSSDAELDQYWKDFGPP